MPKFNIYKLLPNARNPLIQKMAQVGLESTGHQIINDLNFSFYLSNNPEPIDIWWADYYQSFLEEDAPQNLAYYAVLLVFNNSGISYAISLGKSHFYLKNYSDTDFGINLAERIVDENYMKLKNSKFYKSKKSKTITSYLNNTRIDYDSGESLHYIKAQTIDEGRWGKVGAFGHSIQLNLDDVLPKNRSSVN